MPVLRACSLRQVLPQNNKDFRCVILAHSTRFAHAEIWGPTAGDNIGGGNNRGGG
jgi:hypothetical protein